MVANRQNVKKEVSDKENLFTVWKSMFKILVQRFTLKLENLG